MKKKSGFEIRKVGEENIIIATGIKNIDFNHIISMNKSAVLLWKEIGDNEFDRNTLANILNSHYNVDMETATSDAEDLIHQWLQAGIISA